MCNEYKADDCSALWTMTFCRLILPPNYASPHDLINAGSLPVKEHVKGRTIGRPASVDSKVKRASTLYLSSWAGFHHVSILEELGPSRDNGIKTDGAKRRELSKKPFNDDELSCSATNALLMPTLWRFSYRTILERQYLGSLAS